MYIFFLSHMHTDHTKGLEKVSWGFGDIYCSPITAKLMVSKFPHLKDKAKPLELNVRFKLTNEEIGE